MSAIYKDLPAETGPETIETGRQSMSDIDLSHAKLRAGIILAGKEIARLNFGNRDNPTLKVLRRILRESREVARREGFTVRVRLPLS